MSDEELAVKVQCDRFSRPVVSASTIEVLEWYIQHMKQSCLAGVVQTQEEEFGMFVGKSEACEQIAEPESWISFESREHT